MILTHPVNHLSFTLEFGEAGGAVVQNRYLAHEGHLYEGGLTTARHFFRYFHCFVIECG